MNNISKCILGCVAVFTMSTLCVQATEYANTTITRIAAGGAYGGDVVIRLEHHNTGSTPACHFLNSGWTMRFDATTDAGKQAYAIALLAWSTGSTLVVRGEGNCIGNIEKLRWIRGI